MEKVVGIVGGMGPEATADLFLKIIRATKAAKDQDHIQVVIDSNPKIPDRTAFILGKGESPLPLMVAAARNVEQMGASLIAIPCNTAHCFHDEIQSSVHVPVLHMMKEVACFLRGRVRKVGLLATTGTLMTGLYKSALESVGILTLHPEDADQQRVMEAIYRVKAGDLGVAREVAVDQARKLVGRGAEAVVAGCTEVPLILHPGDLPVLVVDATEVLARACVREALGAEAVRR